MPGESWGTMIVRMSHQNYDSSSPSYGIPIQHNIDAKTKDMEW